jgi:hypothetical protein
VIRFISQPSRFSGTNKAALTELSIGSLLVASCVGIFQIARGGFFLKKKERKKESLLYAITRPESKKNVCQEKALGKHQSKAIKDQTILLSAKLHESLSTSSPRELRDLG